VTYVDDLASFAGAIAPPDEIRAIVRQHVLDTIGVSLAAVRLETSQGAIEHARDLGGASQATAIGIRDRLPAPAAAFVNGVLAHSLDYDDTHLPSILHPSASVVPATLAAAELAGADGARSLDAIAAGLEICSRLGMAGFDRCAAQSTYFERGQHATSICGAIAGAASAAVVIGLDADGIGHAMGIAVSMGSGVIEANRAGGTVKRLHCGIAAQSAVNAAMLAARGFTGPPTVLEGRFGFFNAFLHGSYDARALMGGLGEDWEIRRIFFKPYPTNHFTHAGIDAALAMRAEGLRPDVVDTIRLGVATQTVRTIGEPIEAKRAPDTGYQAQFSGPFTIAAALSGGGGGLGLGLDDFTDELARDPARRAIAARVTVEPDRWCDSIYPNQFPAVLTVRTRDGRELTEKVAANRGGPERPLTDAEVVTKFRDNAIRSLGEQGVADIEDACARLDRLEAIGELLAPASEAK
jgi:2-methylcitrate dehydratase PrpD